MSQWDQISRQVAIAGQVLDAQTRRGLPGALVAITTAPVAFRGALELAARRAAAEAPPARRVDQALAGADGAFHFLDLPNGTYSLTASLPVAGAQYAAATARVRVTRSTRNPNAPTLVELALPPTILEGTVAGQDGTALILAEVQIVGRDELALTDSVGQWSFSRLETGTYTLVVTARGYERATERVTLAEPGKRTTLEIKLARGAR